MGKNDGKLNEVQIVTVEHSVWSCGRGGKTDKAATDPENCPEVRIVTMLHRASDTSETVGWSCDAFRRVGDPDEADGWQRIGDEEKRIKENGRAFERAALRVVESLYAEYLAALNDDGSELLARRNLLYVARAELAKEMGRIADKARPEFDAMKGRDLRDCLALSAGWFRSLDQAANIHWRLRTSPDGEAWTSGKDRCANPIAVIGKVERAGAEKAGLIAEHIGWTPDFIVTICHRTWRDTDTNQDRRRALVHHLLSQCGYDAENRKFFVAKPDVTAFSTTVKEFGLTGLNETRFVHDAIEGAARNDQLAQMDLFSALDLAADVRDGMKTAKAKGGGRALSPLAMDGVQKSIKRMQDSLGPGESVTISSGGRSATLKSRKSAPVEQILQDARTIETAVKASFVAKHSTNATVRDMAGQLVESMADETKGAADRLFPKEVTGDGTGEALPPMDDGGEASDADRFELTPVAETALTESNEDAPQDDDFEDGEEEENEDDDFEVEEAEETDAPDTDPEPIPLAEDVSTDPDDTLVMDAIRTACLARTGSPGIMAKARESGATDAELRHIVCVAFVLGVWVRPLGEDLTVWVSGKGGDPRVKIMNAEKVAVCDIGGAELLARVRLAFGIDGPGVRSGAVHATV